MRTRTAMVSAVFVAILVLAASCSKTEPLKMEAPPGSPMASASAAAPAAGGAVADGKALFEQKCGLCHGLGLSTSRTETTAGWTSIVKQMQGKKSGWISDDEAAKIVEFLTAEHGRK
jgi:cytochrome c5